MCAVEEELHISLHSLCIDHQRLRFRPSQYIPYHDVWISEACVGIGIIGFFHTLIPVQAHASFALTKKHQVNDKNTRQKFFNFQEPDAAFFSLLSLHSLCIDTENGNRNWMLFFGGGAVTGTHVVIITFRHVLNTRDNIQRDQTGQCF